MYEDFRARTRIEKSPLPRLLSLEGEFFEQVVCM